MKTREVIKQALTDTISKVKFFREISDPFETKTRGWSNTDPLQHLPGENHENLG